ncbi:hypothetical protein Pint_09254 [Pistacia integerrima]|uniref:Uncharacterized protein n=1 Tax=Pistacia integerrima TaxID=434235 RepID=A0ACC0XXX4_9ROSI|nr:hypothetical protein Pint_09254 [Pistacia integerrima]
MHRSLWRIPYRSIADTLCKPKLHEHGPRNVAPKLELSILTGSGHGKKSTTMSMQMQIVHALRTGERTRASYLLSDLVRGNHLLGAADFIHILQYCARSPESSGCSKCCKLCHNLRLQKMPQLCCIEEFVMETWRMTEEKEIGLNNTCYLLMIRALCKGGYLEEAFNLINFLGKSHGMYPILPMYNCFLGACAKMQSMIHANLCLELMETQMVGKNEITYTELLKVCKLY